MHFSTLLSGLAMMGTTGWAQYVQVDDYLANGNFFDMFTFWDEADPTHGFVQYQNRTSATDMKLLSSSPGNIQMRVDSNNTTPNGRPSVRITSNKSYNTGLFILDLEHMPGGICGTWPAFWLLGPDWPSNGEIDIIEGVNEQSTDDLTLHTGPGCTVSDNGTFSGTMSTDDCYVYAEGQSSNQGCQVTTNNTQTYGLGFNANGGGVYATEWTNEAISIWFFARGWIPPDIIGRTPDPSTWGTPVARFQGGCDIASDFNDMQIVFDTTFCGDWAGNVWSTGSCASKNDTCVDYVAKNPHDFAGAFWSINGLQVYSDLSTYSSKYAEINASSTYMSVAAATSTNVSLVETTISAATSFAISSKSAGLGWAPVVTGTGAVGEAPFGWTPSTASSAVESTASSSESVAPTSEPTGSGPLSYNPESGNWGSWGGHHHGSEKAKRHFRHHKRHGGGLL